MKPAIFLDRDGTINVDVDHLARFSDFKLISGSAEAIKLINEQGFHVVVLTNQSVIARGYCSQSAVETIHRKAKELLLKKGAKIDAIYYCPHYPHKITGGMGKFNIACDCRKPAIGMIKKAVKDLNIDLERSVFVGDTTSDALTAKNAGIKFVGVKTGYGCYDGKYDIEIDPELIKNNLFEAVKYIFEL